MDSPSHISSILPFYSYNTSPSSPSYPSSISSFYSTNSSLTSPSSFYPSYIPSLYPTNTTVTTPSPTSNLSFINSYLLPSTNYYNSYGSENTSYSRYYHNSNYSVSPSAQISNTSTFEPSAATLLQKREIDLTVTDIAIPIFDGTGDGYWWILCIERYFKARGTPEATKVSEAVTGLQGSALQWWLEKHHHSKLSWESFTAVLLWWFKPEYRDVLPLLEDGKEELLISEEKEEGVEEEESKEQKEDSDKEEKEESDSQFLTSGKLDDSVAEAEPISTKTSMVLKDSDKSDKSFSDKVSLSLPCDIVISILGDVKNLCGEPPPPPEPPDGISIPPTNTGLTPKPPPKPPNPSLSTMTPPKPLKKFSLSPSLKPSNPYSPSNLQLACKVQFEPFISCVLHTEHIVFPPSDLHFSSQNESQLLPRKHNPSQTLSANQSAPRVTFCSKKHFIPFLQSSIAHQLYFPFTSTPSLLSLMQFIIALAVSYATHHYTKKIASLSNGFLKNPPTPDVHYLTFQKLMPFNIPPIFMRHSLIFSWPNSISNTCSSFIFQKYYSLRSTI